MIMRLKAFAFPTDWVFKDPDTGTQFRAKDKTSLVKHIITYRAQNRLPQIEHLDIVLENYLCQQPKMQGGCVPRHLQRNLMAYAKGGLQLIKNLARGKFVTQEEADRRSKICLTCPNNVFPDKGKFLEWSDIVAIQSVGKLRSIHHNELGNCGVCTCPLRAKVWIKPPFKLSKEHEEQMRGDKPNCWQLPENEFKDRIDKE